jgi:integrase/recombinase XerD
LPLGSRPGFAPFRRTGCSMLRAGAPLAEIDQALRRRRLLSTAIYAKAGTEALRALTRPWPGGAV